MASTVVARSQSVPDVGLTADFSEVSGSQVGDQQIILAQQADPPTLGDIEQAVVAPGPPPPAAGAGPSQDGPNQDRQDSQFVANGEESFTDFLLRLLAARGGREEVLNVEFSVDSGTSSTAESELPGGVVEDGEELATGNTRTRNVDYFSLQLDVSANFGDNVELGFTVRHSNGSMDSTNNTPFSNNSSSTDVSRTSATARITIYSGGGEVGNGALQIKGFEEMQASARRLSEALDAIQNEPEPHNVMGRVSAAVARFQTEVMGTLSLLALHEEPRPTPESFASSIDQHLIGVTRSYLDTFRDSGGVDDEALGSLYRSYGLLEEGASPFAAGEYDNDGPSQRALDIAEQLLGRRDL